MDIIKKIYNKALFEVSYFTGQQFVYPEFISILLTFKCNFRCKSCDIWKKAYPELELHQWEVIANKIISYFPADSFIELNGGEPLLRKELAFYLVSKLKPNFSRVGINSNGSLFTSDLARQLKAAGMDFVKFSVYSGKREAHDEMRGYEGAYEKVMAAIDFCREAGIETEVGILVTSRNIEDIPQLILNLRKLNPLIRIILQPLDETIESETSKEKGGNSINRELWPDGKQVEKFFHWVSQNTNQIKNSGQNLQHIKQYYLDPPAILRSRCFTGQRNVVIYPNGKVALCFKGEKVGNLLEDEWPDILGRKAKAQRKKIKNCKKYCRISGCNYYRGIKELFLPQLH